MVDFFDPKTTEIKPGPADALSISQDYDTDPNQPPHPVLLFVPDTRKPDHWHIPLTELEAEALWNWLDAYLKRNAPYP